MPKIPLIVPQLGESIAEAKIVTLLIAVGDDVCADQEIFEVETSKATMGVTSPCAGRVAELRARVGESYTVGAVLGLLEVSEAEAERAGLTHAVERQEGAAREGTGSPSRAKADRVEPTLRGLPVPVHASGASYLSPRMKARMDDLGLHAADLAGLAGSGAGGRVTTEDFERFLDELESKTISAASPMRVAVADAMRRSWTRPLATVGRRVELDAMLDHRRASESKPGPALYALRALAIALGEGSAPAGRLIGDQIVHPVAIDIGFAVEAEDGVLVPVIRAADRTALAELVRRYNELVALARDRRLPPEATGGSIATVTNFGTFGIEWATPIPLPEQTLVLGLGSGMRVPKWDEARQAWQPVMMAELTLSFDHRVLDGGAAGRLLARISQLLQEPARL